MHTLHSRYDFSAVRKVSHIFSFHCTVSKKLQEGFLQKYFPGVLERLPNENDKKSLWFEFRNKNDLNLNLLLSVTICLFQNTIWEFKLKKKAPSATTFCNKLLLKLEAVIVSSPILKVAVIELSAASTAMDTEESNLSERADMAPAATNSQAESNIGDRARAYIAKKKEEMVGSVRAIFADRIATYDAIKNFNKRREEALDLDGGADRMSGLFGDFLLAGDGRMGMVQLLVNFSRKTCKTYSFDPETMYCSMCKDKDHKLMGGAYVASEMGGERIVVFTGDQALPPGWISSSGGYPATIRIEYGSLRDIAEEVAAVTRGWKVPASSIIFLSSATQLMGAGLGHYMADFCSCASWLDGIFSREVIILPGVPFLLEGTDAPILIRAMADMATWVGE